MRVEKISENKIKVLIDSTEAKELNIDSSMLARNTPEVQRMFRMAIRIAEESADFYIDGAKLFVETIPSYTDGIGMLITKVCSEGELEEAVNNCSYRGVIRRNEIPSAVTVRKKQLKLIYRFSDFDAVCAAARELCAVYVGDSSLYKLEDMFYLYLAPSDAVSLMEADMILPEFAHKMEHGQFVHGRLNEYGELMIKHDAILVLTEYYCPAG